MMPVTSSRSRLRKARLSVPSGKPSRTKRVRRSNTSTQLPSFSGKFPFSSTKASPRPSIIEPSMIHCCPWICCRTSSQTPLLQTDSISWCERRLLVVSASSLWCRLLLMLHIVSHVRFRSLQRHIRMLFSRRISPFSSHKDTVGCLDCGTIEGGSSGAPMARSRDYQR